MFRKLSISIVALMLGNLAQSAEVVGIGNISRVVSDIDRAMEFYQGVLGLEPAMGPTEFSNNPAVMELGNTPGAQSRIATLAVPGEDFGIELIEYRDIARGAAQFRFQDPGATVLQISLRDMNPILGRLERSVGRIWTPTGEPVSAGPGTRIIFLQDPDGFFIELIESGDAPEGAGNIFGAGFEVIIDDSETSANFYRAAFSADPLISETFIDTPALHANVATNGAAFLRTTMSMPGTDLDMAFLEFSGIYRKRLQSQVQDPGTALLQLYVDDVPGMIERLVDSGGELITAGGGAVDFGGGILLAIVRGPDNLYLELMPPRLGQP